MPAPRRFDSDYSEEIVLRDGTPVQLRLVRGEDKPLFEDGFERLSAQSRYDRFFTGKNRLSSPELRYLTEIDGDDHFALGALERQRDGRERGLGVARFVRLREQPDVAEPAVTVVDEHQRNGLGRALCERLVDAARERGIARFRAEILASNASVRSLIRNLAPDATEHEDGETLVVEFPIPEGEQDGPPVIRGTLIDQLLALAGQGLLVVRKAFDRIQSRN